MTKMTKDNVFNPGFTNSPSHPLRRTAVVAGGAGFIGSNLCKRLIGQGDRVVCVDNLGTGRRSNVAELLDNENFAFFDHDIIEPFEIAGPVNRIYNMACPGSPPKYQYDPIHTFKTSVLGGFNLLDLAKRKSARILQSSTSEVYGDPSVTPQSEDYRGLVNTVGPRACYDEGKRGAETLFYLMQEREGVDTRIARIFNTYGPGMDPGDGRVVSNFIIQALTGADLTIYGDGNQTRSFCYVDDMLDGLTALMEADDAEGVHNPVNLGNPGEFSVSELAEIVIEMTGSKSKLVYKALPLDDPHQRRPDISRAGELLGWAPGIALRAGLVRTISYFKEEIERQKQPKGNVA